MPFPALRHQAAPSPAALRGQVVALIPAHNEADRIAAAINGLHAQIRRPDKIIVLADNCTDATVAVARKCGALTLESLGNSHKKAGALNQALALLLPRLGPEDMILVQDADTVLVPRFVSAARKVLLNGAGACGGVFYGEEGGGLLGLLQRAEFARYARQLHRSSGRARVLTGTATMFTTGALRSLLAARQSGRLPGGGGVYTTASLTEDGEITLALKSLGFRCVSPGACTVTTEVMSAVPTWWRQRTRWQRGALDDLRAYGWTRATAPYILRQGGMALSVAMFALYVAWTAVTTARYGWHTTPFWAGVTAFFVIERAVTARRAGWRAMLLAALLVPELAYDALQHAVWLTCVAGAALKTKPAWHAT
ncbi:MAG: glycosyltransferase [Streptosporangiaceae bacterium]